jgi:hypothetical protein
MTPRNSQKTGEEKLPKQELKRLRLLSDGLDEEINITGPETFQIFPHRSTLIEAPLQWKANLERAQPSWLPFPLSQKHEKEVKKYGSNHKNPRC